MNVILRNIFQYSFFYSFYNHIQCPYQKGINENTNGLIKESYQKGIDLSVVNKDELKSTQELLNKILKKVHKL